MSKYLFSIVFLYFLFGFTLFLLQRKLLFNKSNLPKKPIDYGLLNVKEVFVHTSDSIKLLAWFTKPKKDKPLLIYFHGNSFDIGERAHRIKRYCDKGWGVLLLAWRGFSGNLGQPTEKNLYLDGEAAIKWVKNNTNLNNSEIILYGESLGGGVAVELGTRDEYKSIVLEAPFISVTNLAKKRYFIYPVKHLILDNFDNLDKINKILSPLLIINGKKDEVIPYSNGIELYNKAKEPKKYVCIDEAMHNNLYDFNIDKEVISFNS